MKKIIIGIGLILFALQSLMAQQKTPDKAAQKKATMATHKLSQELSLSKKQTSDIQQKLGVYYMNKEKTAKSSKTADEKKKAIKNLDQQKILAMRAILTDKQYNKFVQLQLRAQ